VAWATAKALYALLWWDSIGSPLPRRKANPFAALYRHYRHSNLSRHRCNREQGEPAWGNACAGSSK
jgi:hypothetical protein